MNFKKPKNILHHTASLSDEDYESYILAKFEAAKKPSDHILKARVWKALRKRLIESKNRYIGFMGMFASILLVCLYFGISDKSQDEFVQRNGISSPDIKVIWDSKAPQQVDVNIKLLSQQSAFIGFIVQKEGAFYEAHDRTPLNTNEDLQLNFAIDAGQRLCILRTNSITELDSILKNIDLLWGNIPSDHCWAN